MACTSLGIPTSPASTRTNGIFKKQSNGLYRSGSNKDLRSRSSAIMQRSYSDNHICYCANGTHATQTEPKLKASRSMGIFPFQLSGSIIPNSLRSFLFDPETSKDMSMVEKDTNMADNTGDDDEGQDLKRANWVGRLLEIRSQWRNRQPKEDVDEDGVYDEEQIGDCDCDENESGCAVNYNSEEEDGEVRYDRESFSRFLAKVPWSDTKQFSTLAFLSNIAYVIPEIKVCLSSTSLQGCVFHFLSQLNFKVEIQICT